MRPYGPPPAAAGPMASRLAASIRLMRFRPGGLRCCFGGFQHLVHCHQQSGHLSRPHRHLLSSPHLIPHTPPHTPTPHAATTLLPPLSLPVCVWCPCVPPSLPGVRATRRALCCCRSHDRCKSVSQSVMLALWRPGAAAAARAPWRESGPPVRVRGCLIGRRSSQQHSAADQAHRGATAPPRPFSPPSAYRATCCSPR